MRQAPSCPATCPSGSSSHGVEPGGCGMCSHTPGHTNAQSAPTVLCFAQALGSSLPAAQLRGCSLLTSDCSLVETCWCHGAGKWLCCFLLDPAVLNWLFTSIWTGIRMTGVWHLRWYTLWSQIFQDNGKANRVNMKIKQKLEALVFFFFGWTATHIPLSWQAQQHRAWEQQQFPSSLCAQPPRCSERSLCRVTNPGV